MDYGATVFPTDYAIRPDDLARLLEERGFESYWAPEHTHIPASRRTPYPGGTELPKEYWHTHDPFVALTAAAMATTKLKVATGICLIIERDPITTAKAVASLDFLSNGRMTLGTASGHLEREFEILGVPYHERGAITDEYLAAIIELWTSEHPSFQGQYVQFDKIQGLIEKGLEEGAQLVIGGLGKPEGLETGYYVKPTIFRDVSNDITIAREEIFGPVLCMIPYSSLDEAIAIANDTDYGLSGYVYGATTEEAMAVARQLRTGMVHLNGADNDIRAPFGGYKQSGNGREWGASGIEDYLETKAVMAA